MKNLLLVLIAATAITFTSCSKESKLNKRLDGTWNVTKIDGEALEGASIETTFNKDGKEGTYETKLTSPFGNATESGSYTLEEDTKLIFTDSDGEKSTANVLEYSKTDLKLKDDEDGTILDLVKK